MKNFFIGIVVGAVLNLGAAYLIFQPEVDEVRGKFEAAKDGWGACLLTEGTILDSLDQCRAGLEQDAETLRGAAEAIQGLQQEVVQLRKGCLRPRPRPIKPAIRK